MKARVDEQNVIKANAQFWEQMLAMSLDALSPEKLCLGAGHMFGVVALKGVWKRARRSSMANGLAYEATAAMMMQALETVVETDALDATKEIANMRLREPSSPHCRGHVR